MRGAIVGLLLTGFIISLLARPVIAEDGQKIKQNSVREGVSEELRLWVDARAGTGTPVHWIASGGVFEYPTGKKLFGMVGFDSSRVIWPSKKGGAIIHLTRKTFAYTDPVTDEILTEYNGKRVAPIAYPYQMITYRFENSMIFGDVEQGAGDAIQQIKMKDGMGMRWLGRDTLVVTAPIFLDFPLPNGSRYEAWENYDFFLHKGDKIDEPYQMSRQRYGALPPWAGTGKAIYHLVSWRVENESQFPVKLLAWARADMPMWLVPPSGIDEIRALQLGTAGEGWAK